MPRGLFFFFASIVLLTGQAFANDHFYVNVFAYQAKQGNPPELSHTFGTFFRVSQSGNLLESVTISWGPRSGRVLVNAIPEPGVNMDLDATLRSAQRKNLQITSWGPYKISADFFERARLQRNRLESGKIQYVVLDRRYRPNYATNCIHALGDVLPGLFKTMFRRGEDASRFVISTFRSRFLAMDDETDRYVTAQYQRLLGLRSYPIRFSN